MRFFMGSGASKKKKGAAPAGDGAGDNTTAQQASALGVKTDAEQRYESPEKGRDSGGLDSPDVDRDVSARKEDENAASNSDTEAEMLENILKEKVAAAERQRPRSNRSNITNASRGPSPYEEQPGSLMNMKPAAANSSGGGGSPPASSRFNGTHTAPRPQPVETHGGSSSSSRRPDVSGGGPSPTFGEDPSPVAARQPRTRPGGGLGGNGNAAAHLNAFMEASESDGEQGAAHFGLSPLRNPGKGDRSGGSKSSARGSVALVVAGFVPQGDNQIAAGKGEVVSVIDTSHAEEYGWIWCESSARPGEQGWLPSNCLDLTYKEDHGPTRRHSTNSADLASTAGGSQAGEDPLAQWNEKLAETFVLHSMRNLVRLVQYVVNLLNPYGAATSLHIACWRGSIDAVEVMIEADPDLIKRLHATAGQLTPLHVATICNYPEVVQFLLDARANCNIPTVHELCPLHLAASASNELVEILVAARANVDAEDADGNTPLIFACCYHQVQTIEYLVERQADVRKCNRWDVSPLHLAGAYAELDGALYGVQVLCSVGADPWVKDAGNLTPIQTVRRVLAKADAGKQADIKGGPKTLDPVQEFLEQFTSVTQLKPAARQAVLKKRRRDREAKEKKDMETPREGPKGRRKSDALIMGETDTPREDDEEAKAKEAAAIKSSTIGKELQDESQRLANEARELRRKLEQAENQLKQAESSSAANKDLAGQISQQRRDQERDFEKKLTERENEMKKQVKKLESELEAKDADWKKKMEDEKTRLKKINEEITEQLLQKSEKKSSGDVASLNVKLQSLEGDLRSAKASLDSKTSELAVRKEELSKLKEEKSKENRSLQQELDSKKERVRVLEAQIRQLQTQLDAKGDELQQAKHGLSRLDEYTERAERAERALQPLEQRNVELERMFAEEQGIRRKYHNQIQELKGAIRVYCRVRPRIKKETDAGEEQWLGKLDEFSVNLRRDERRENKEYTFDGIFDENNTQEQVFRECKDLIQSAVDGFNITIFAYGQTGAGKTHTMYGGEGDHAGLVPRSIKEIFAIKQKNVNRYEIKVKVYMVEVYRDELADLLLQTKKAPGPLEIKRDSRGTIYIENVSEIGVQTSEELQDWLDRGMARRHTAATKMNTDSSRSHLITTILLEVYNRSKKTTALGKISLVDLAGSERLKKSEATGEVAKEAMAINKSLTALGDVIEALTSKAKHIPYRNHKLTELMSDSLGGNAKTLMFANCSPAASNCEESMGTLNYASRAKLITNNVSKQQESKEISRLKQVIATMSREMSMKGGDLKAPDQAGLQAALLGT